MWCTYLHLIWPIHIFLVCLADFFSLLNVCHRQKVMLGSIFRSSHPEVFLGKGILKICSKFTGEHPCRCEISIKLQSSFIEITLQNGCSPVNLLHIFRISFLKNTSGWLLLLFLTKLSFLRCCWHLFVPSQQWKQQNDVWNPFKVKNKDTRMTSLTSVWCIYG